MHLQVTDRPDEMVVWWITSGPVSSVVQYSMDQVRWEQAANWTSPGDRYTQSDSYISGTPGWDSISIHLSSTSSGMLSSDFDKNSMHDHNQTNNQSDSRDGLRMDPRGYIERSSDWTYCILL